MPRRHVIWILITVAMGIALLVVWRRPSPGPRPAADNFQAVRDTYDLIRQVHYADADEDKLRRGAVRGMVETLDEFSSYIAPDEAEDLNDHIFGTARGLGLRLDYDARANLQPVAVLGIEPNSPASQAGIRPGEILLAVNDVPVSGLDRPAIERLLDTARESRPAELTLRDVDQGGTPRTVSLKAARYDIETVRGLVLSPGGTWRYRLPGPETIGYLKIREFCPQTPGRLQHVLRANGPFPGGLILDLRDNPGGLLEEAIATAELFLDAGEIVTVTRRDESPRVYRAHDDTPWGKVPLVVLVNDQSASAAELLAGSLAANARAILIGTRTHGKGCVQSMIELRDGLGQINLTSKEFRIVPDEPIQRHADSDRWGVDPHIRQEQDASDPSRLDALRARAELLRAESPDEPSSSQPADTTGDLAGDIIQTDMQLQLAVELLRSPEEYTRRMEIIAADVERARRLRKARPRTETDHER